MESASGTDLTPTGGMEVRTIARPEREHDDLARRGRVHDVDAAVTTKNAARVADVGEHLALGGARLAAERREPRNVTASSPGGDHRRTWRCAQ